jgi:hypothetical protein
MVIDWSWGQSSAAAQLAVPGPAPASSRRDGANWGTRCFTASSTADIAA